MLHGYNSCKYQTDRYIHEIGCGRLAIKQREAKIALCITAYGIRPPRNHDEEDGRKGHAISNVSVKTRFLNSKTKISLRTQYINKKSTLIHETVFASTSKQAL